MEVGCLKHPGASTIGSQKTAPAYGWQIPATSHEPPGSKRNWHPSHCGNSGKREGKEGGRRTVWAMSCHTTKHKRTIPVRMPRYAKLESTHIWNSDTWTYVSRLLTSRGMQALFVVNSVKLHLTTFNGFLQGFPQLFLNSRKSLLTFLYQKKFPKDVFKFWNLL